MVSLKYIAFIDIIRCWIGLIKPISYQVCLGIFDVGRSGCRSALAFDSNMRRGGRDSPPSQLTETPCHSNLSDAHTKSWPSKDSKADSNDSPTDQTTHNSYSDYTLIVDRHRIPCHTHHLFQILVLHRVDGRRLIILYSSTSSHVQIHGFVAEFFAIIYLRA